MNENQKNITLVWLQREFRLSDFPALETALNLPGLVVFAYFHDPKHTIGEANSVWLAHSLQSLQADIRHQQGELWMLEGDFAESFSKLLTQYAITDVFYTFQVGSPFKQQQDTALSLCKQLKVSLRPFMSEFMNEPNTMLNQKEQPYLVFTPFYKNWLTQNDRLSPFKALPTHLLNKTAQLKPEATWLTLPADLQRLAKTSWAEKMMRHWQVGEQSAWQMLARFIEQLSNYSEKRDFPAEQATSMLSSYLHFGQVNSISLYFALQAGIEAGELKTADAQPWIRQLVWREFAKHLLWWYPHTESQPFKAQYENMSWSEDSATLVKWQQGKTGYPLIDAAMRELWQTGIMHNRTRMLVASFLTKNLNQHWLHGKAWFDNTLLDADPANNSMGWQWVAGCGVDASPYYRLFNPVLQSEKFDGEGAYLRTWVPELAKLPNKAIHSPWQYDQECKANHLILGKHYPKPIIDLTDSRSAHLARVADLKTA